MSEESAPDLREAMSHLAAGVAVITTTDVVGRDCGLTVTSLSSVSLDPPLCVVAVRRNGFLHDALEVADGWAVTVLASSQRPLAHYAARHRYPSDTDDFAPYGPMRGRSSGALYFPDGVAALECVPHALLPAGDHTLALGRVVAVPADLRGADPLLYHRRHYVGVGPVIGDR